MLISKVSILHYKKIFFFTFFRSFFFLFNLKKNIELWFLFRFFLLKVIFYFFIFIIVATYSIIDLETFLVTWYAEKYALGNFSWFLLYVWVYHSLFKLVIKKYFNAYLSLATILFFLTKILYWIDFFGLIFFHTFIGLKEIFIDYIKINKLQIIFLSFYWFLCNYFFILIFFDLSNFYLLKVWKLVV